MGSSVNDRELVLETLLLITKEGEYSCLLYTSDAADE